MHIKKIEGIPALFEVPTGYKALVLGEYQDPDMQIFFAFIAPENVQTNPGSVIQGVRYAEGYENEKEMFIVDCNHAQRKNNGEYEFFLGNKNRSGIEFNINPPREGTSFCEKREVKTLSFRR